MDLALVTSAALLGLAGTPHCAAMCAAPCAAATAGQGRAGTLAFHLGRVASYAALGGLAAASVAALAQWSQWAPALRPLWSMLHAAAFALGLWLVWQGRQPAWMGRLGHLPTVALPVRAAAAPARALIAGSLWGAWPCGLLQSALVMAALASAAPAGAAAMGAFALTSSSGLLLGPWAWRKWVAGPQRDARERKLVRLAGLMLALAAGWGLSHDYWHRVAVWCGLA